MNEDSSTHTGSPVQKPEPLGVIEIITQIKHGTTDPKSLDPGDRRQCAAYLFGEGMSTPEIARLLKVTERTIRRDREQIREEQSVSRDPSLAGRIAGQLFAEAENTVQRIRRVVRERDASHAVRVQGETECFSIFCKLTERLQSLGYLPTAPTQIQASVLHAEAVPTFDELEREINELLEIAESAGDEGTRLSLLTAKQENDKQRIAWGVELVRKEQFKQEGGEHAQA